MKSLKNISTLIFAVFVASTSLAQDKKAHNIDNSNIALQSYSPVSYLDLRKAELGRKEFKSEYNKVTYYFTNADQKKAFDKNPGRYLPQYGGYCAFGVYAGAKFRPDPNNFIVKDGEYFLYLKNLELDAKELWLAEKNHDKLVDVANKNWGKLKTTYN